MREENYELTSTKQKTKIYKTLMTKECSISELKDMMVREIELNFGEGSDNVKVSVGECHLTFDDLVSLE